MLQIVSQSWIRGAIAIVAGVFVGALLIPLGFGIKSADAAIATEPDYRFSQIMDTTNGGANVNSVATDSQGNVYTTGSTYDTVIHDGPGGSETITVGSSGAGYITKWNSAGDYLQTFLVEETTGGGYVDARSIVIDSDDNVYFAGNFAGTATFDGPSGTDTRTNINTNNNGTAYVTKYNADGTYGWTNLFDISATVDSSVNAYGLAVDQQNNVYLAGIFTDTVTFGGTDTATVSRASMFVTKYNTDGTYGYTKTSVASGASNGHYAQAYDVVVDSQGNVYVTGSFRGTNIFDGPGGTNSLTSSSDKVYVVKYDSSGDFVYVRTLTGGTTYAYSLAIDDDDNLFVAGHFVVTVDFDMTSGTDSKSVSQFSPYISKYNADGTYAWTNVQPVTTGAAEAASLATDPDGNVYMTGNLRGNITFDGPGGSESYNPVGNSVAYMTRYNADGSYAYTRVIEVDEFNDLQASTQNGVAINTLGNLYMVGGFSGDAVFDADSNDTTTSVSYSPYLLSYNIFTPLGAPSNGTPSTGPSVPVAPAAPNAGYEKNSLLPVAVAIITAFGIAALMMTRLYAVQKTR